MVVNCLIEFENNGSDTYLAGQVVRGKVTLTADVQKQVKAVTLKIKGLAHTSWSEDEGMGDDKKSVDYTGHIDYIKSKTQLFVSNKGSSTDTEFVIIEPGVHCFPFTCHIPPHSPSSVEGFSGYIRYWVQITLKRPWKFDQIYTKGFTVVNIKDLNYDGELKLPVNTDITKVFCCGPFKSDPLQLHVQLPQTGYVPGQLIPVSILVTNDTKARINEICVRLVMVVNLFSTHPLHKSKSETRTVSKLIGDPVLRHCKKHFNYLLPIPATPPTCYTLCSIIQIAYRVEVEAKMQGMMFTNQCIHTPVTIGNVPLQMDGMVVQQQPMFRQFDITENYGSGVGIIENNNDLSTSNRNMEPWSAMGNIPAPVYMEATHMPQGKLSEESAHDYGEKNFSPKYPVFNIPSPTSLQPSNGDETDGPVCPPTVTDPDKTTWL
ncbi:arrestin domain-containing protein 17-like isoform X1 [Calliphora vicina]|uniref:arrestin domain-containing protein 17-like isoform X1 n=1 Tax=Calliphora vicina TaxID=7373 RepID=UPI00325B0369